MSDAPRRRAAWLAASALCVAAAVVVLVVLKAHWLARELPWMLGGALALVACFALAQACYRHAYRDAPHPHDVEAVLLRQIEDLQESRRLLRDARKTLDAHRHLLDEEGAGAVDDLLASGDPRDDAMPALDAHARRFKRNRRIGVALAWIVGMGATLALLETAP